MRSRVGFWMPSCRTGGSEIHNLSLLRLLDGARIAVTAIGVLEESDNDPYMLEKFSHYAPIHMGVSGLTRVAAQSDVIVQWAIPNPADFIVDHRPRIIMVSHADDRWPWFNDRQAAASPGVDRYVAVSRAALSAVPPDRRDEAVIIPNCVDLSRHHAVIDSTINDEFGIPGHSRVLLSVCRLSGEKNPLAVFEMLHHLPADFHAVLVGDGFLAAAAAQFAAAHPRAIWVGLRRDVVRFYERADWYVCGSATEGFGLSMVEAMSCAVPVVARRGLGVLSEHPGIAQEVDDFSPKGLAAGVLSDLALDYRELRNRRSLAQKVVNQWYGEERFGTEWTNFLVTEGQLLTGVS